MLVLPAARLTPTYVPRPRSTDLLYQTLQRHVATFLARAQERDRKVPGHVERELLSYLACGIPAHGFALLRCDACDGRWMCQTAAHLVERVFPEVPVRQWVLTLPMPLRCPKCGRVMRVHAIVRGMPPPHPMPRSPVLGGDPLFDLCTGS